MKHETAKVPRPVPMGFQLTWRRAGCRADPVTCAREFPCLLHPEEPQGAVGADSTGDDSEFSVGEAKSDADFGCYKGVTY